MSNIVEREIAQGFVPIGTPKAYQYDASLVELAKATVQQGLTDVQETSASAVTNIVSQGEKSVSTIETVGSAIIRQIENGYGYPFTANTVSAMTDTSKIYVYTGSESGYTAGNWYYYNGSAWVSGGIFNSTAFETDKTLTVSGASADAKVTGIVANVFVGSYPQFVGGYITDAGNNGNSSTRARTIGYLPKNIIGVDHVASGYEYRIVAYQQDGTYVGTWNGSSLTNTVTFLTDSKLYFKDISAVYKYRIDFKKTDGSTITSQDAVDNLFFMYATDNTLTNVGYPADSGTVGDVVKARDVSNDALHNLINYGYSTTEEVLEKNARSSTDTTSFEIRRTGTVITVDGGSATGNARVRLSGTLTRSVTTSTIKGWSGISLTNGNRYRVTMRYLSVGAINNASNLAVVVYEEGTDSTIGGAYRDTDKNTYTRIFTASSTPVSIILYISSNTVLDNAVVSVTLEDITDNSVTETDERINTLHNLVNYGYLTEDLLPYASGELGQFQVLQNNTFIKISGTNASYDFRVSISGLKRTVTDSATKQWADGVQLKEGYTYKATLRYLTPEQMNGVSLSVYKLGEAKTIGTREIFDNRYERTFVAPAEKVNLVIYVAKGIVLDNAGFEVELEELTVINEIAPFFAEEMDDTVAKVQNIKDEPCLTFMWVTDIHKDSSNALGVQTFTKMIQNMTTFAKSVHCDFVLNTGDDTDGNVAQATTLARAYDMTKSFLSVGVPYIKAHGNHDNNPYYQSGSAVFDIKQCFKAYYTLTPHNVTINVAENGTDFYIDYNDLGVRFISVNDNNCKTSNTYSWGETTPTWIATALDTDKTVLLALHISPINTQVYDNQSVKTSTRNNAVLSAFDSFVNGGGNLIMLSGHSHADMGFVTPFLSVMSVCQRYYEDSGSVDDDEGYQAISGYVDVIKRPVREAGTYTEDAWTVGVYKPISNELRLIRFGAGTDRTFHVTPVSPQTLTSELTGALEWSSSDETVATVSDAGVVTGVASGRCGVVAKDEAGNYECWVVVVA